MPVLALQPHPTTPQPYVTGLEVTVVRSSSRFELRYAVTGELQQLSLNPFSRLEPADRLWEHTCFEVFLKPADDVRYIEMNFAPSGGFAAYSFSDYRAGMTALAISPSIQSRRTDREYLLDVAVDWPFSTERVHLAVSAVIEDCAGQRSYWALAHAPGRPDFHHPDVFIHTLTVGSLS